MGLLTLDLSLSVVFSAIGLSHSRRGVIGKPVQCTTVGLTGDFAHSAGSMAQSVSVEVDLVGGASRVLWSSVTLH